MPRNIRISAFIFADIPINLSIALCFALYLIY